MSERITGHTELIGLMSCPIRHSNSPAMQNEAFEKLGYDYAYLAFEVGANEIRVGMKSLEGMSVISDQSYFHPDLIVVDILYSPPETAMASLELWTEKPIPIEYMKDILHISYDD